MLSEARGDDSIDAIARRINEKFVLVERGGFSVTLSGR
jgi:hypothetical protein